MNEAIGEASFLARSQTRVRLLEEIYEHEVLGKDELKERVDASRTTIQRNLDRLEERGWIDGDNRKYWTTRSGRPVTAQFLRLLDTIHAAKRLQPFLEYLTLEDLDLELHRLATADITVSDERNPYAPVNRHIDLMRSAERFRCLLPAVGLQPMMVARDRVVEHGSTHKVVIDRDIVETLRSEGNYRDVVDDLLASDRAEILVSETAIPFYLGVAEGVVQIGVGDDRGVPQSLLEFESGDIFQWAEKKYSEYEGTAQPLLSHWPGLSIPERDSR